jgi:hypothetical protein
MIKYAILFFVTIYFSQNHCGLDLTTYLVVKNIKNKDINLKITIVDKNDKELINLNSQFSFLDVNQPLIFKKNKKKENTDEWDLNLIKDEAYYISLKSDFILLVDEFKIKVQNLLNTDFVSIFPINQINFYKFCKQEVKSFGPKMTNQPIIIEY